MGDIIPPENVQFMGGGGYRVLSSSGNDTYEVEDEGDVWTCTCPHHTHRGAVCKHIVACQSS